MQLRKVITTPRRRAGPPETATAGWSIFQSRRTSERRGPFFILFYFFLNTSSLFSSVDSQKDPGRSRVPVVCLERLKILVSQLPPHGRRQSDPLPASGTEAPPPQSTWHPAVAEVWLILLLFVMRCWKIKGNQIQYFFFNLRSSSSNHFCVCL